MAVAVAASPRVWGAFDRVGSLTQRGIDQTPWKATAAVLAVGALLYSLWEKTSTGSVVWSTVFVAVLALVVLGRRRFPQAAGVVVSTAVSSAAVLVAAFASMAVTGLPVVSWHIILAVPMLLVVTVAVFAAPHRGVHVGWSVAIAHAAVLSALPVAVWAPNSNWTTLAAFVSFVVALSGVYFRSRHAERPAAGLWRRIARGIAVGAVSLFAALTMLLGAPGQAQGLWGIGDFFENKANDMICSFTRPDLTQSSVGTGPESMLPSRNFGQVKGAPPMADPNSVPAWSDQIGNYDRLGPNYSLDNYTLYEIAGLRGVRYVNWQKNTSGDEVCSIMPWVSVTTGNIVMSVNTYLLQMVITLKEISQSGRPFEFLYDKTLPLVDTLFTGLFLPASGLMLVIAGVSVVSRAAAGGSGFRSALGDVGGTAAILVATGLFFGGLAGASWVNPGTNGFFIFGSMLDTAAGKLNSGIAEASFSALDLDGNSSLCKPPQPVPASPGQDEAYAAAAPGQRYSSCILAEGLAYRPWAIGQFGGAGNTVISAAEKPKRFGDPRVGGKSTLVSAKSDADGQGVPCYNNYGGCTDLRSYLIAQEGGPSFAAARDKCMNDEGDYTHLIQCDPYHAVANQMNLKEKNGKPAEASQAASITSAYHGEGMFPHLTQALVALVATAITAAGVGAVALLSMWWQFMLVILFITGVARLLYASFPGKASAGKEYAGDFISTFLQRIGYGLLSVAMIAGVALIFGSTMAMGLKIMFVALLMLGMLKALKKVQEAMKVQGSTSMKGPVDAMGRAVNIAGGLAAYKAGSMVADGVGKTVGGSARGAGRAAKWAVTRPQQPPSGGGRPVPGRGPASPTTGPGKGSQRSPMGRVGEKVATGAGAAGAGIATAARAAGRGAGVAASPLARRPAGWTADRLDAAKVGARAKGRRADRAIGKAIAPVTKAEGRATETTKKLGSRAVAAGREHAESAVSYLTPRSYAEHLSDQFKERSDARAEGRGWSRTSFADHEARRDARDEMYVVKAVRRRRNTSGYD